LRWIEAEKVGLASQPAGRVRDDSERM
jgi:hypothetical protein